jgi:hypothetical protein
MNTDETTMGGASSWMRHVKKTMRANKGMKLRAALKLASKTFKKSKKGGAALTPLPLEGGPAGAPAGASTVGGRRRRGSRKSRGSRKH